MQIRVFKIMKPLRCFNLSESHEKIMTVKIYICMLGNYNDRSVCLSCLLEVHMVGHSSESECGVHSFNEKKNARGEVP
jgi:hypothetical protein